MNDFEKLLNDKLKELPYTKHADDGQYNDGQINGFENGARWVLNLLKSGVLDGVSNCKHDWTTGYFEGNVSQCCKCGQKDF